MFDLPRNVQEYVNCIGRTGRIGNRGQATSFYNDRNAELAPDLTKLLIECNHSVPDFFQDHIPSDGVLNFDEAEASFAGGGDTVQGWGVGEASGGAIGDSWGAPAPASNGNGENSAGQPTGNAWGASEQTPETSGWGAEPAAATSGDAW